MSPSKQTTCPECKAPIGEGTGTDVYKHVIQCLHLPNEGVKELLAKHQGKSDERSRRVLAALELALEET